MAFIKFYILFIVDFFSLILVFKKHRIPIVCILTAESGWAHFTFCALSECLACLALDQPCAGLFSRAREGFLQLSVDSDLSFQKTVTLLRPTDGSYSLLLAFIFLLTHSFIHSADFRSFCGPYSYWTVLGAQREVEPWLSLALTLTFRQ